MRPSGVTSLLSLPDELLDKIVNELQDESIIQLGTTCRKFHFLALPTIFIRAKLSKDPTSFYLQQPSAHLLRALRIALLVRHATSFVVSLNPDVERRLPEILSLSRLVSRMSTMAMSAFIFPLANLPLFLSNEVGAFDEERWTREVIRLFDIVLDKSCASLKVSGHMMLARPAPTGAQPTNASPPRVALSRRLFFKKIVDRLGNLPKPSKCTILSIIPQKLRHLGSRRHPRNLRRFDAHSPSLFQGHFLNWTISTLQTSSRLTEVSFKTDGVPASTWRGLLSKLTLPSLSKFRVTCDRIVEQRTLEFNDMLKFLNRHPSIVELDLYGLIAPTNSHRPENLLPALQTLTSHPELITWILDGEYPLKQLRSLNMVSDVYLRSQSFDYNTFDDALSLLPRGAPSVTALNLSFFSVPGVTEWLDKHISRDHGFTSGVKGIITLELVSPRSWEGQVMNLIPDFVAQFPALQHLIYPAITPNLDMEIAKMALLREILLTCPKLRTFTIRGVEKIDFDSLREYGYKFLGHYD